MCTAVWSFKDFQDEVLLFYDADDNPFVNSHNITMSGDVTALLPVNFTRAEAYGPGWYSAGSYAHHCAIQYVYFQCYSFNFRIEIIPRSKHEQ